MHHFIPWVLRFCLACRVERPGEEAGSQGRAWAQGLAVTAQHRGSERIQGDLSLRLADPRRQGQGASPGSGLWLSSGWESRDQRWVMLEESMTRPFLP